VSAPAVLYSKEGPVATVVMNRPEVKNALNGEMLVRLADAWQDINDDVNVRVAILTGAGRGFCAGVDLDALRGLFAGHRPPASLLHGDLWHGNIGFTPEGPVLFDPAVYYGDREADLAMTELFGGFPAAFYAAYQAAWPLDSGYAQRKHLYNLYHVLNHLNLFGAGYLGQARALVARLTALTREIS